MKAKQLMAFIAEEAKTQGFYGFAYGKIDRDNLWQELAEQMELYGAQDNEDIQEYLEEMDYFRHCEVLTALPCKTYFEWSSSNSGGFSQWCKPLDLISSRIYWHFLEVLPPHIKQSGFMCSEPYGVDYETNESTYAAFCNVNGKHYFLGVIAPSKYNAALQQAKNLI